MIPGVVPHDRKTMTFDETCKDVIAEFNSDCWNYYLSNMEGKCVEELYNVRKVHNDVLWENAQIRNELDIKRDNITENTSAILKRCSENNLSLQIIKGCKDFIGFCYYYYYPNTDGTFDLIKMEAPKDILIVSNRIPVSALSNDPLQISGVAFL